MGEHFERIKQKTRRIRLCRATLLAIALSALALGALLWLSVLKVWNAGLLLLILIPLSVFCATWGLTFCLTRLSDDALAKLLDERFGLQERVQTMRDHRYFTLPIYLLQRKDAEAALAKIEKKAVPFRRLWLCILALAVGVGALVSAILYVPAPEPPPPPPVDVPFALTALQEAAMEELIAYVQASEMQSPYRENIVLTLTTLLTDLKQATTTRERDAATAPAMEEILTQTNASSDAIALMEALWGCNTASTRALAKALNFYDWPRADEWDKFNSTWNSFRNTLVHADSITEAPDHDLMLADTTRLLMEVSSQISNSLQKTELTEKDLLRLTLNRLALANEENADGTRVYGLLTLSQKSADMTYESLQRELDATATALGSEVYRSLEQHAANIATGEYAMTKIADLFGATLPQFRRPNLRDSANSDNAGDNEENAGAQGGIGSGTAYGSDDLVLDPFTNQYVEYGKILEKYYNLMFGKLQDGDYTDEEKLALEKYFDILYGGFAQNDD